MVLTCYYVYCPDGYHRWCWLPCDGTPRHHSRPVFRKDKLPRAIEAQKMSTAPHRQKIEWGRQCLAAYCIIPIPMFTLLYYSKNMTTFTITFTPIYFFQFHYCEHNCKTKIYCTLIYYKMFRLIDHNKVILTSVLTGWCWLCFNDKILMNKFLKRFEVWSWQLIMFSVDIVRW